MLPLCERKAVRFMLPAFMPRCYCVCSTKELKEGSLSEVRSQATHCRANHTSSSLGPRARPCVWSETETVTPRALKNVHTPAISTKAVIKILCQLSGVTSPADTPQVSSANENSARPRSHTSQTHRHTQITVSCRGDELL